MQLDVLVQQALPVVGGGAQRAPGVGERALAVCDLLLVAARAQPLQAAAFLLEHLEIHLWILTDVIKCKKVNK